MRPIFQLKCSLKLLRRRVLAESPRERRQVGVQRRRMAEDVARHEPKERVRDFAVFGDRQTRAAVFRREYIRPFA